ncbi:hypothetical protein PIB30_052738 [Stylosanthes scabra]|uniref:Uncharacterized protein n=1 Tax=Stylosanthes scabra TaxID=79078 RepID=A0ABU6UHP8_9FABA|nr:hypothetical protein [Stylosanthes scabra]
MLGSCVVPSHVMVECVLKVCEIPFPSWLIGIEKGIRKAKEGIEEQKVHKRKPKSEKQGTVRSHSPIVRPHVSLEAFRDVSCQYSCDRTVLPRDRVGAKSKLQSLLTVQPHRVRRVRTVPSGRIKIKARNGISSFRARSKALERPNSTYMKEEQLKHNNTNFPLDQL